MNRLLTAAAGMMLSAMALSAGTISYGAPADGIYFGSGNGATSFTLDTSSQTGGTLELGLSAVIRYIGPAEEDLSDYYVPPGDTTVPGKTGASWDLVYSVDTNVGDAGTSDVADYTYNLEVDDLTTGDIANFDPSSSLLGNNTLGDYGFQNAEALSFSFISSQMPDYNVNSSDTYQITLSATPLSGGNTESVQIDVNVTPEPRTWVLLGAGLAGLLIVRRRSLSF